MGDAASLPLVVMLVATGCDTGFAVQNATLANLPRVPPRPLRPLRLILLMTTTAVILGSPSPRVSGQSGPLAARGSNKVKLDGRWCRVEGGEAPAVPRDSIVPLCRKVSLGPSRPSNIG
jgi:hypothetical protein